MVSPWMENGNVLSYTRKNPEVNRLQLVNLIERRTNVGFDYRFLPANQCSKWCEVPSPDESSTREHSRSMSRLSWVPDVGAFLNIFIVKHPD